DRVFEIAPAFRAEPSDTVRHVTEFESFDGEVAWIEGQEDVLGFLEGAVDHAIDRVRAAGKAELELLGASPVRPKLPFKRVRYGMPPHGGWGFGLDRFVQKLLDLPNIREAILFPRDRTRLVPLPARGSKSFVAASPIHCCTF